MRCRAMPYVSQPACCQQDTIRVLRLNARMFQASGINLEEEESRLVAGRERNAISQTPLPKETLCINRDPFNQKVTQIRNQKLRYCTLLVAVTANCRLHVAQREPLLTHLVACVFFVVLTKWGMQNPPKNPIAPCDWLSSHGNAFFFRWARFCTPLRSSPGSSSGVIMARVPTCPPAAL